MAMTVLEHLRDILADSITGPLSGIGIHLTDVRTGYTVALYSGVNDGFTRSVQIVRDKWWNKTRGRFTVFLIVDPPRTDPNDPHSENASIPLADLMGHTTSDWKIWATDDKASFVDQLQTGMIEHGIPWIERVSSTAGYAEWAEEEAF